MNRKNTILDQVRRNGSVTLSNIQDRNFVMDAISFNDPEFRSFKLEDTLDGLIVSENCDTCPTPEDPACNCTQGSYSTNWQMLRAIVTNRGLEVPAPILRFLTNNNRYANSFKVRVENDNYALYISEAHPSESGTNILTISANRNRLVIPMRLLRNIHADVPDMPVMFWIAQNGSRYGISITED